MYSKKRIALDMFLNIIAAAIPIFVLQFIILPSISNAMEDESYGLLVTILSLLNVVPSTMGIVLNNIRLIFGMDSLYEDDHLKLQPDYHVLLLLMIVTNLAIVGLFLYVYERESSIYNLMLTLAVSVLWLMRDYYIVAFRIKLNYMHMVISNLALAAGYAAGSFLFLKTGYWQIIYICGHAVSLAYIFVKCDLWREPLKISPRFKDLTWQTLLLFCASVLTRITTYADKMFIFPVLGGATVSVYYVATLFGKVVSMTITPVSSVMLSYLSKSRKKDDNIFRYVFLSGVLICIIGYFICVFISRPILSLIYPKYVDQAMNYIWITTATVVLSALISIINPFVLKFFDMKWQIAINGIYTAVYVGLSMFLLALFGLYGFCIGGIISTALKLVLMLYVFRRRKERKL